MIWRGEIYDIHLGQPIGHEPAFTRPAVVISADIINNNPGNLVVVVPISSTPYGLRSHVKLDAGSSGRDHPSYGRCDQLRVISTERILARRGATTADELHAIAQAVRCILEL